MSTKEIKFKRCTAIHKGNAFLYYMYDKNIPGYFIPSIAIADNVEDKKYFIDIYEYFCTEIVRDRDIYCVLFDNNVGMFDKYMDSKIEYQGKDLYKVKKYDDIRILQYHEAQKIKGVA